MYKKITSAICHYCDYCTCNKNKRCNWYKKFVKRYKKKVGRKWQILH